MKRVSSMLAVLLFSLMVMPVSASSVSENSSYSSTVYITEVYSLNNEISNAYYKPLLEDVPNLEAQVLNQGFTSAYTGYWDLNHSSVYTAGKVTGRALEILGSDFALASESYDVSSGKYNPVEVNVNHITMMTAIMDVYKALGLEEYDYEFVYSSMSSSDIQQSPAIQSLPDTSMNISGSKGVTKVFVTRTSPTMYRNKAAKEMLFSNSYMDSTSAITSGEFIVLVKQMMEHYGEPVISTAEMNTMLQVYGGDIPSYLSTSEQDAYMYLKAKGCLNDDTIDYTQALTLQQMLDILVCVADEDSRSTYKEIQLTMNVSSDLQDAGYFPKTVTIASDENAIQVEAEYDYSSATAYDYYILIDDNTRFVDSSTGDSTAAQIFVPSVPSEHTSQALDGSSYLGIVTDDVGNSYYHLSIPIMSSSDSYFDAGKAIFGTTYFQVNTTNGSDSPVYIWVQQGGGIYKATQADEGGGVPTTRTAFSDEQFEGSVCAERCGNTVASSSTGFLGVLDNLVASVKSLLFEPIEAKAAVTSGVGCKLTVYHAENIIENSIPTSTEIPNSSYEFVPQADGTKIMHAVVPVGYVQKFLSALQRDTSKSVAVTYDGVATLYGDVLISFNKLVEAGLFYAEDDGSIPSAVDNVLTLNSKYGPIQLNANTNEIVVGETIYKVSSENTVLWSLGEDSNGNTDLLVDFRVAYGWTENICDMAITGTGDSYTINLVTHESGEDWDSSSINENVSVNLPASFRQGFDSQYVSILKQGVLNSECPQLILSRHYALANWIIYEAKKSTGEQYDYCFVYYPKSAFSSEEAPDGVTEMVNAIGYSIGSDDWVIRCIPLTRVESDVPGTFTYSEKYGYLYNIPEWDNFELDKYLDGTYALPISRDGSMLVNANVNIYAGYEYGTRPLTNYDTKNCIDIKGHESTVSSTTTSSSTFVAAPAGVIAFYGGGSVNVTTFGNIASVLGSNESTASKTKLYYFGTQRCNMEKSSEGITKLSYSVGSGSSKYTASWVLSSDTKFYRVNEVGGSVDKDLGTRTYAYTYVTFKDVTVKQTSVDTEGLTAENTVVVDIESVEDEYKDYDEFSISYLLTQLDKATTWVILFALYVIPMVGIIGLTILVGLAFISQNKMFVELASKTVDPVKLLTGGTQTMQTINLRKAVISVIIGYFIFGMLLQGNIFKIVKWLGSWWYVFIELLRQL